MCNFQNYLVCFKNNNFHIFYTPINNTLKANYNYLYVNINIVVLKVNFQSRKLIKNHK
jgi:hypothetical protein